VKERISWLIMRGTNELEARSGNVEDMEDEAVPVIMRQIRMLLGLRLRNTITKMSYFAYKTIELIWINERTKMVSTRMFKGDDELPRNRGILSIN